MPRVIVSISMSLDGFIAGSNISPANPLGNNGERLHDWLFSKRTDADEQIMNSFTDSCGAVIVGWRTYFEAIHDAWGGNNPFTIPAVVLCNEQPDPKDVVTGGFTFVTDGLQATLAKAKELARDKNVWIMGGANTVQQYIESRLVDEIYIHIAPVLLAKGKRLFENIGSELIELKTEEAVQTPAATHIRYLVRK